MESVGDECLERKMSLWVLGFLGSMGMKIKGSMFLKPVKSVESMWCLGFFWLCGFFFPSGAA